MHSLLRSRQQLLSSECILAPSSTPRPLPPPQLNPAQTRTHTFFFSLPFSTACHKGPAYQSATVAGCSFSPGCLTKEGKDTISSVDMTIVWTQRARLTIGLFPYVAQAEHTHLFVCVSVAGKKGAPHVLLFGANY